MLQGSPFNFVVAYILGQHLEACSSLQTWYPLRKTPGEVTEVPQALETVLSLYVLRSSALYIQQHRTGSGCFISFKKVVHKSVGKLSVSEQRTFQGLIFMVSRKTLKMEVRHKVEAFTR